MKDKLSVDALAQEIRRVDGSHSLGAGALADALMPFISAILDAEGDGGAVGVEKSEVWIVQDETGQPIHCASWPEACHEHINDAINEHGIEEAKAWKVIHYTHPARSGVVSDEDVRDAERLKEIVRRAEKVIGFRRVRFELRFDPLTDTDLSLIDYIDAALQEKGNG